ncbi:hypothetical protein [Yinghuangia sp. YIM S09857]|uniref:hypothetical protein n=1 Tax=Yinghuangia sp. YIM S09857 TaxID=3436929 RepID=UPI003F533416
MGVLFDYYRAPDAAAALRALERDGGPKGRGAPGQPVFDAMDAKGIDFAVMLVPLVDAVAGTVTDFTAPDSLDFVLVWPAGDAAAATPEDPSGDEGVLIAELGQRTRDALADADDTRLPEFAARWGRAAGLDGDLTGLAADFVALARRARDAGDRLYCWSAV